MAKAYIPSKRFIEYDGLQFHERAHPDAYELAIAEARQAGRGKLLDLGAGAGLTSYRLSKAGFDVTAADINADQFVPKEIPFVKVDLNGRIPADDGSLNVVLALEIIEHLESPPAFIREIARVLEPGGTAVLSTPNIVSLPSKLRFLFNSEFTLFFDAENRTKDSFCAEATGHISPLLPWLLRGFLTDAGLDERKRSYTPKLGIRTRHLAQTCVITAVRTCD